jgi:hypothetical protein
MDGKPSFPLASVHPSVDGGHYNRVTGAHGFAFLQGS